MMESVLVIVCAHVEAGFSQIQSHNNYFCLPFRHHTKIEIMHNSEKNAMTVIATQPIII